MSNDITFIDQIRESRRVRMVGEPMIDFSLRPTTRLHSSVFFANQRKAREISVDSTRLDWELIPAKNPFDLSFNEFLRLSIEETEDMIKEVSVICKSLIEDAWKSGCRQIILCKERVVFKTNEEEPISPEKIEEIAKENDSACYVFSAPDMVEELAWTQISGADSYPTIQVFLGSEDTAEGEIICKSPPILADFDTGNPFYKIFNANLLGKELQTFNAFELREGRHLGYDYPYFNKRVKICVKDVNGKTNSLVCQVRLIRDWDRCAIIQLSPKRCAYVGRDLLRDLRVRLKLDAIKSTTQILDVS